MAQIQGDLSHDARVLVWDETTGALVADESKSAGSYSIGSLTGDDKIVTAIRDTDGESLTYSQITPIGEIVDSYLNPLASADNGYCYYNGNFVNGQTHSPPGHDIPCGYICFYPPTTQGATIHSATLTFTTDNGGWGPTNQPTLYVRFLNADDAAQPVAANASSKTTFNNTTKTSAVTYVTQDPELTGKTQTVTGLASIVQTVIDRAGWSADNRLICFLGGSTGNIYANDLNGQGRANIRNYDYGSTLPQLHINWEG